MEILEILEIRSEVVIIFKDGNIPLTEMRNKNSFDAIAKVFNFDKVNVNSNISDPSSQFMITFLSGKYSDIHISRVIIDARRLIVDVIGDDEKSSLICNRFIESIESLRENCKLSIAVKTFTTTLTFKLEKSLNSLLANPKLLPVVTKNTINLDKTSNTIVPFGAYFQIFYNVPNTLSEQEITLNSKLIRIERKFGTELNDNIYISVMPFPVNEHIKVLNEIIGLI